VSTASDFKYWQPNSPTKAKLVKFVEEAVNPQSKNYIPPEARIATFDLDGTLYCETAPYYFQEMMFLHRVLEDKNYQPTEEMVAVAKEVQPLILGKKPIPKELNARMGKVLHQSYAGMTADEYAAYVKKFMETPAEGLTNLKRGESFYLPMVEVVSYLTANDFKVFIVSGTDRQALRILAEGVLPIEKDRIIGTDITWLASHQQGKDGLDYVYQKNDEVLRGEFILKNVKMNKVDNIVRDIGQQPVLAFGNSSGDSSMFNYTITGNKYKSLAFALCCDDLDRELGSQSKADKMRADCGKYGWIPVSMKDDFKTIYGDNVKRADR
jgi:phosphoglycolate phosphatase-like HAD superfamily hydrolase